MTSQTEFFVGGMNLEQTFANKARTAILNFLIYVPSNLLTYLRNMPARATDGRSGSAISYTVFKVTRRGAR